MFMREALKAGKYPLTSPSAKATSNDNPAVGTLTFMESGTPSAMNPRVR